MSAYAVLIAFAVYLLHGTLLYAVLILFGLLIFKSLVAVKAGWLPPGSISEQPDSRADSKVNQTDLPRDSG